jgi:hypothetical protein
MANKTQNVRLEAIFLTMIQINDEEKLLNDLIYN